MSCRHGSWDVGLGGSCSGGLVWCGSGSGSGLLMVVLWWVVAVMDVLWRRDGHIPMVKRDTMSKREKEGVKKRENRIGYDEKNKK